MTAEAVVEASASSAADLAEDLEAVFPLAAGLVEVSEEVRAQGGPADSLEPAALAVLEGVGAVHLRTVTISLQIGVDPITINGTGFKRIFNWPINRGDFKCA
jgi:hypothetical protein